jgi:hypothetical protein
MTVTPSTAAAAATILIVLLALVMRLRWEDEISRRKQADIDDEPIIF